MRDPKTEQSTQRGSIDHSSLVRFHWTRFMMPRIVSVHSMTYQGMVFTRQNLDLELSVGLDAEVNELFQHFAHCTTTLQAGPN